MEIAEFDARFPMLAAASWNMFVDGGGSDHFRNDFNVSLKENLPFLTEEQLIVVEAELAKLEEEQLETLICGEHYEQIRVNQKPDVHFVLNVLFDGPPQRFNKTLQHYVPMSYEEWLPGFHEDVAAAMKG